MNQTSNDKINLTNSVRMDEVDKEVSQLLLSNSSTRIRSRDAFMLIALWMQLFPKPVFFNAAQPTGNNKFKFAKIRKGVVLVSAEERILVADSNGEAHAIVRALLNSPVPPKGCDVYVSRFPCSLCTKIMVQAGVRKCYYFPAKKWEMQIDEEGNVKEKKEKNRRSVSRLVSNNTIEKALGLYIPQWDHSYLERCAVETANSSYTNFTGLFADVPNIWELDEEISTHAGIAPRWNTISLKFRKTLAAIAHLKRIYDVPVFKQIHHHQLVSSCLEGEMEECPEIISHAIVLAHIAARRTDDPKVGVGAIIIENNRYVSIAWNGFPKKAQHLDYPQAGADDSIEDEELKYDYILHAEQNALLWRNPTGVRLKEATLVTTKKPCDECSPMIHDMGITKAFTNRQTLKSIDDPARLRGTLLIITKITCFRPKLR
ncbi:Cytidine and dCMP deaminase domain-containing protein 1 [Lobulomyces angularis]|nr:Cytidine and dCMP deaminase domain-containing protein 1 [Lobulomyces angularis]